MMAIHFHSVRPKQSQDENMDDYNQEVDDGSNDIEQSESNHLQNTAATDNHSSPALPSTGIAASATKHVQQFTRKSSVRNMSRRSLSNIPAAKPDGLWFKRRKDEPFHVRYVLPSDHEHDTTQSQQHGNYYTLQQTLVSAMLSIACYLCLLFSLPTIALLLWWRFRTQTGGVIPLPIDNSTTWNNTFGSDIVTELP
ncbi:hypothetical protein MPSEU_000623500 [Mayamaea pseudoterrestris]|nr:hypothetical protein MPSEU_000623500 [Mayamaea pseudoterrestris]